ncbi:MAG TPA: multidrug effflux MFS transporter [Burkholderiaceae bacterium]|nr:multidrug effflux MFS transporter [Burkholderiaceae bacterium]
MPDPSVAAAPMPRPQRALAPVVVAIGLALLLGLQPVTTDLYLPALPMLARELAASPGAVQQTMSALILGFGLMQLVWGPVADRFGRRPVLLSSLALLVVAGVGAAMSTHIAQLVAWRTAQGAMLAAAVVCARAMVRDLYEPHQGARVMALAMSGLGVLAVSAPLGGGLLTAAYGWRATLVTVAAMAAIALLYVWRQLPETLTQRNPHALRLRSMLASTLAVVAHPTFRAWGLLTSATYGGLFVLLSASSFAYIGVLGLTPAQYGAALASASLSYLVGTLVCRRWLSRHGLVGTVKRGALFTLAGALGMAACGLAAQVSWPAVLLAHWCYCFGHGMHQPCGQTAVVGPFPRMAGLASALAGCLMALVAFVTGVTLGAAMDGSLRPMAFGTAAWGLVTALTAWTLVQRHGQPAAAP